MDTSIENIIRGMHYEGLKLTAVLIQTKVRIGFDYPLLNRCVRARNTAEDLYRHQPTLLRKLDIIVTNIFLMSLILCTVPFAVTASLTRTLLFYPILVIDELAHLTAPKLSALIAKIQKALPFLKKDNPQTDAEEPSTNLEGGSRNCTICLETAYPCESIVERPGCQLACQEFPIHTFCFEEWKKQRNICPRCKIPNPEKGVTFGYLLSQVATVYVRYRYRNSTYYGERVAANTLSYYIEGHDPSIIINPNNLLKTLKAKGIPAQKRNSLGCTVISIKEFGATKDRSIYLNRSDNHVIYSDFDLVKMFDAETNKRNNERPIGWRPRGRTIRRPLNRNYRNAPEIRFNAQELQQYINEQELRQNPPEQSRISPARSLIILSCVALAVGLFAISKAIQKYNELPILDAGHSK